MGKKGVGDIKAIGFTGMNNLLMPSSKFVDRQTGLITPNCILNADVINGTVNKRKGFHKVISLVSPHSLWSNGSLMLCVAQGQSYPQAIYRVGTESATELAVLPDMRTPMFYLDIGGIVFLSSKYWKGIYNVSENSFTSWGIDVPPAPKAILVDGDLVPGHYRLCYTYFIDGRLSGNGGIVDIHIDGGNRGILLEDAPDNIVTWITHPNGGDFIIPSIDNNTITEVYGVHRLPTLDVIPPPFLENLAYFSGRIWGSSGNTIYYSEPFQYENFKHKNILRFTDDITMIAPVDDGMFVSTKKSISFLSGREPDKMNVVHSVGAGAIPGTLSYGMVAGGGYQVSRKLSQIQAAIWNSSAGIVMGVQGGHILYLTEGQNDVFPKSMGATLVRTVGGIQQIVNTTFGISLANQVPEDIQFILDSGKLAVRQSDYCLEAAGGFILSGQFTNQSVGA